MSPIDAALVLASLLLAVLVVGVWAVERVDTSALPDEPLVRNTLGALLVIPPFCSIILTFLMALHPMDVAFATAGGDIHSWTLGLWMFVVAVGLGWLPWLVFLGSPALLAPERADGRAGAASSTLSTLKRVLTPAPQPTRSAQAANEAIAAIQQLHAMKDANAAALALSRATRIYLADRYSIDATRMTSSQILVGLPRLTDQNRSAVETILLGTDRLKFAADGAAASTVEQLASVFQDLVHRTAVRELAIHDLPVGVHNG